LKIDLLAANPWERFKSP